MNIDDVLIFLYVAEDLSLTKAAERLFLSQPTVSNRLRALEDEINMKLILRHKGQRTVELTPEGKSFLPIAEQWAALYHDTDRLKNRRFRSELRIGCPDTLSDGFFLPLFRSLLYSEHTIHLSIKTYHSQDTVRAVSERKVDVSLGFYHRSFPNVVAHPIFHEKMLAIISEPSAAMRAAEPIHPSALLRENEFYTYWSPEFQQWHDSWWSPDEKPFAEVDTVLQLRELLCGENHWALIPYYLGDVFRAEGRFAVRSLAVPSPERLCYLFHHRYPNPFAEKNILIFKNMILDYSRKLGG